MVSWIFSWYTLGYLVPNAQSLNAYPSIVAHHVHPFISLPISLPVYLSSDGCLQQDNASCHKAKKKLEQFFEHNKELFVLKWPPLSPDLKAIKHLWEIHVMDVMLSRQYESKSLRNDFSTLWNVCQEELRQF